MQEKTMRLIIRTRIRENDLFLLSSFGLEGIKRSWFKEKTILDIISRFTDDRDESYVLDLFFDELATEYINDSQFDNFTLEEIIDFIKEEKSFMLGRLS